MASHVAQHFVPAFLLEQWHTGGDGDAKLYAFRWANGKLIHSRRTAKHVAKEDHLYSFEGSDGSPDTSIERTFMGPHVDDPAAVVHKLLLNKGLGTLTEKQHYEWARFLGSMRVRVPSVMARLRVLGTESLVDSLNSDPSAYEAIRGDSPYSSLLEYFKAHERRLFEDFGTRMLPDLIQSETLMRRFLVDRTWTVRSFQETRYDLLIGDDPLIGVGSPDADFAFYLPLSPRAVFVVSSRPELAKKLEALDDATVVRDLNEYTAAKAQRYVYATGVGQESFLRKHLKRPV